jgi:hypothetical protein
MSTFEPTPEASSPQTKPIAFHPLSLRPLALHPSDSISDEQYRLYFNGYFVAALFVNIFALFLANHISDMGFWYSWTTHLVDVGYKNFSGNYPPIYLHWLYVSGNFMEMMGFPIDSGIMLKFFNQLPIILSHLLFTALVFKLLVRFQATALQLNAVMLITALNPAILFDGPVWGQVDMFPTVFIMVAFYLVAINKATYLVLPLFTVALLTKFQMICFAPVFAVIFFKNARDTLIGCLLSVALIALIFLPFVVSASFVNVIKQAYIDTLGEYPYSTLNASNIWMIITENSAPDNTPFLGNQAITVKMAGIAFFFVTTLTVFLSGLYQLWSNPHRSPKAFAEHLVFSALICSTGFFLLLPGMHERYIIPAVITALMYAVFRPDRAIYAVLLSIVGLFNMTQVHPITNSEIWIGLSWILVITFIAMAIDYSPAKKWLSSKRFLFKRAFSHKNVPMVATLCVGVFISCLFYTQYRLQGVSINDNQRLLTEIKPIRANQDFGVLQVNRNVSKSILSTGGRKYANGFGTHANSTVEFVLPEGTEMFEFLPGIDDMSAGGDVKFYVYGDGRELWQSSVMSRYSKDARVVQLPVKGVRILTLRVDGLGSISSDHANWINPILTME